MSDLTKEQVVEFLSNLPVIQIAELVKELEEKWGVSAAPVAQIGVGPTTPVEEAVEKTEFDVVLESVGNKIAAIKEVRGLTGLGLKEAKDKVESAPVTILEAVDKAKADEVKAKLEESGCKVILK